MKRINILYLVSTLKRSGPINIVFGIIKNLDLKKFNIFILTLSKEENGSMLESFQKLDIKILTLNFSRIEGVLKSKSEVQLIVNQYHIDIVHSHGFRADKINSKLKNAKSISTIHNFPKEDYLMKFGKFKGRLMEIYHKNAIKNIQNPIACSKTISEKFESNYGIRTDYIQNGIDISAFKNFIRSRNELKKELELPLNKTIFIVSGSLIFRKDPYTILKAFNQLENSNWFLIFIGDGELYKNLVENNHNKNIKFYGNVSNVIDFLAVSDFYLSTSISEGLPNSVLEAMAVGLPPILSNISSHSEIIGEKYEYLIKVNDKDDLSNKINKIINDDYDKLSTISIKIVEDNFTSTLMSKRYQEKYKTLCQNLEN